MRLYSGMVNDFVRASAHNQIAETLKDAFFRHYRYHPGPSEVHSWQNSLRAMSQVFTTCSFTDQGVILEYRLPLSSKRLDCIVCAEDGAKRENAVIVELKQWEKCGEAGGEHLVTTWVGGRERDTLHPSAQVGQYRKYLEGTSTVFHEGERPVGLAACAYLHNYHPVPDDHLYAPRFDGLLEECPAFCADEVPQLESFLTERLAGGNGQAVMTKVEASRYRPSRKLMDHVAEMIGGRPEYVLIDEQYVVYNRVLACAREAVGRGRKTVIVVRGGPGTGKSVIALNLMAELLREGRNAQYATGSKAFTETLRKVIGTRGQAQFNYFNSFGLADVNEIDVLICDEAHRIRETSNNRYTPRASRSGKPQIQELIDASRVGLYFIDDRQGVRPNEIGTSDYLLESGRKNDCRVFEFELDIQFRCAGSDGFVKWVNNTLGLERTANVLWDAGDDFDFRIFGSPEELEAAIRGQVAAGHTARLTAGFCWPWSKPTPEGLLVRDVQIGDYLRPWNARSGAGRLARGIPKESLWAHDANGLEQVGCIYTAQGFEFDYVGVIFGPDLVYDFDRQAWAGHPERSHDRSVKQGKEQFTDLVKNVYRVLLSRGLKGCYVHFMDRDTERFVRSRVEGVG